MERRSFLTAAALAVAAATPAPAQTPAQYPPSPGFLEEGGMKYRLLGTTGQRVSLIGVGGFHLAKPGGPTADDATRIVHAAVDRGLNFMDNCWDYNDGESERRLGAALQGGWRQKVFLMTKIDGRTGASAMRQIEDSLQRLRTDHLDLLQFHEIIRMDDPEKVFAPGAALDTALKARAQGKLRFIGFTGHKSPAIHKHMFEVAAAHDFHFDTVQMPLNVMDAHYDSFERIVLPIALKSGTGVLGMKALGDPFILDSRTVTAPEALRYAMSLPVSVTVTGIDRMEILDQALKAIADFQPLSAAERSDILGRTATAAEKGHFEKYKISHHFDGTIKNPQWLG